MNMQRHINTQCTWSSVTDILYIIGQRKAYSVYKCIYSVYWHMSVRVLSHPDHAYLRKLELRVTGLGSDLKDISHLIHKASSFLTDWLVKSLTYSTSTDDDIKARFQVYCHILDINASRCHLVRWCWVYYCVNFRHVWEDDVFVFLRLFCTTHSVVVLSGSSGFTKVQLENPQALRASFRCLCSFSWAWALVSTLSAQWCRVLITPILCPSGWW